MDEREQCVVIKFLWLQEQRCKLIHAHLRGTLGALTVSLLTVKWLVCRFREGNTSCKDKTRSGRSLTIFEDVLSKFLLKYPIASANIIAKHFDISVLTVKDLLIRELGLRKFTRRWVSHSLSAAQKREWVTQSRLMLDLLRQHQAADFKAIATKDESWLCYVYPSRTMFARSRNQVTPCLRNEMDASKVIITLFFTGNQILMLNALQKRCKFNQDYFLEQVLPSLARQRRFNQPKKTALDCVIHMDNSMCHNTLTIFTRSQPVWFLVV
jgi:hypothetical protein